MPNLSDWAVRHRALVAFLIALLFAAGTLSYLRLGRAEDPAFTVKVMTVSAFWPGATAAEMQDQVADRIERKLQDLPRLLHLDTFVRPGAAYVKVSLRDDTPPAEVKPLWYQVRKKLDDIAHTFPAGVQGPVANDEFSDVYAALFALTGADNPTLVRLAERARDRLRRVPGVEKVVIEGEQPQRIHVEISHARLATLGIAPDAVLEAIARQNPVAAAGHVETGSLRLMVRVDGRLDGVRAVEDTPVAAGGQSLRVRDLATVTRGIADPPATAIRYRGEPAVVIAVALAQGTNGQAVGAALQDAVAAIRADLPAGVEIAQTADQPAVIRAAVDEFLLKFAAALAVVLVVSFLSLGFRTGIIVALSVPLTLAIVFLVMDAAGMQLHRVTLGALILSLGLLVDDAIIAIETMVVKLEEGWDRVRAATFAWTSTAFPMLTGTLVTAVGFLPVGFAASTAGEYAGAIFWVVGLALIASWVVAVIFTPYLGVALLPAPRRARHHDALYDGAAYRVLRRAVDWCVDHRWWVIGAIVALFLAAAAGMSMVKQQFFPISARPELLVDLQLRQGASFAATEAAARAVEASVVGDPDATHVSTYIGAGSPRFFLALNPELPNESFAKLVIVARDTAARERLMARLQALAARGAIPEARLRVTRLEFGPPVDYPVAFRVTGADASEVRRTADRVLEALRATPGARDARVTWGERAPSLRVALDQARLAELGLAPADIAATLETLLAGRTVTRMREGTKLVDVVVRAVPAERLTADGLPDLSIVTPRGAVPLAQVARIVAGTEDPILWRRDREPFIQVGADVQPGLQGPDVSAAAEPRIAAIRATLPPGMRIDVAGAKEESVKANAALFALFPPMIAGMLLLLMIQLQNARRVVLVYATAPLGVIGAVAALLVADAPFGFVALLGVIALGGMLMRNTLILVDQIDQDLAAGHAMRRAIVESTVRRARPVVLTALAAVLAFVPLTLNVFWGPMAVAMIGGLTVGTALTLLGLPALAALVLRLDRPARAAVPAAVAVPAE